MFTHRPTRRFRKSVARTTLAAATLGMAALIAQLARAKGALVFYAPRRADDGAPASAPS
jgi:hypothetical protein